MRTEAEVKKARTHMVAAAAGAARAIIIEACFSFGPFGIVLPRGLRIRIDGECLSRDEVNDLCWQDGFRDGPQSMAWERFAEHWRKDGRNQTVDGVLHFEGDLIFWDYRHPISEAQRWARRMKRKAA